MGRRKDDTFAQVFGQHDGSERLWFIGYSEGAPDETWCGQYVSTATGKFRLSAWSDELKAWIIAFVAPIYDENTTATSAGTIPGTSNPAEPVSIWD